MSICKSRASLGVSTVLGLGIVWPVLAQEAPPANDAGQAVGVPSAMVESEAPESGPVAEAGAPDAEVVAPAAEGEATAAVAEGGNATATAAETVETPSDLDEIVVTARRMEERLLDVPISITAYNQQQLTDRNVVAAGDLATYTPSLSANLRYGSDNASFAIRGFSQEIRTTASVGLYFADVVAARGGGSTPSGDGAGPGAFFDLQNAQVLKGPQGTLFGRNTTGGAVLLVPKKPTSA